MTVVCHCCLWYEANNTKSLHLFFYSCFYVFVDSYYMGIVCVVLHGYSLCWFLFSNFGFICGGW